MVKVKVLHLTHTDITIDGRILKEVRSLSVDYEVIGLGVSKERKTKKNLITVMSRPVLSSRVIGYLVCIFKILSQLLKVKAEVVHVHDWYMLPLACIGKLCQKSYIIYDAHELEVDVNSSSQLRKYGAIFVEFIFVRFLDRFITVSDTINDYYINRYSSINSENSAVILNAPCEYVVRETSARDRIKVNESKINVIYVGGIEKGRGIEQFIEICRENQSDVVFYVLGYGSLEASLIQYVNDRSLSNIKFLGRVSHEEVTAYVELMDYGLCTIEPVSKSDEYCLPNKLFEYYCSGKRVIGSSLIEIERFIIENDCGFILKDSCSGVQFLEKIKNDIESASANSGKCINDKYYWEYQEELLKKLYKGLIKSEK